MRHGSGAQLTDTRVPRLASLPQTGVLLADYFATCILMPKEWVTEKWVEVMDLDRMAEIFDAPKSAMCIRLKRLGLI